MEDYALKDKKRAEEMAEQLSSFVNSISGVSYDSFAERLTKYTHRTLQQCVFKLFYTCVKKWSELYELGIYDARNEDTCKMSNEIVKHLKDRDYISFI